MESEGNGALLFTLVATIVAKLLPLFLDGLEFTAWFLVTVLLCVSPFYQVLETSSPVGSL